MAVCRLQTHFLMLGERLSAFVSCPREKLFRLTETVALLNFPLIQYQVRLEELLRWFFEEHLIFVPKISIELTQTETDRLKKKPILAKGNVIMT
jgi:hypothetical protein